jgi:hypothetical protein
MTPLVALARAEKEEMTCTLGTRAACDPAFNYHAHIQPRLLLPFVYIAYTVHQSSPTVQVMRDIL